jgi:hypothetical protein
MDAFLVQRFWCGATSKLQARLSCARGAGAPSKLARPNRNRRSAPPSPAAAALPGPSEPTVSVAAEMQRSAARHCAWWRRGSGSLAGVASVLSLGSHGCKAASHLKMNAALTEEEGKCDPVSVSNRYFGPWAVSLGWQLILWEKSPHHLLNFRESPFFLPKLQNRTKHLRQLLKPFILPP